MNNIFDYFRKRLDYLPDDSTWKELPVDSPCGQDCVRAIDAAHAFIQACDPSVRPAIVKAARQAVMIFWHG